MTGWLGPAPTYMSCLVCYKSTPKVQSVSQYSISQRYAIMTQRSKTFQFRTLSNIPKIFSFQKLSKEGKMEWISFRRIPSLQCWNKKEAIYSYQSENIICVTLIAYQNWFSVRSLLTKIQCHNIQQNHFIFIASKPR